MSEVTVIPVETQIHRAFLKGISVGLVVPAAACCFWVAIWTVMRVPGHGEVFKSVNVEMPVATQFLMWVYPHAAVFFVAMAMACILVTALKGDHWSAAALNIVGCSLGMLWHAFLTIALTLPLMSLLRGIGPR